MQAVKDAVLDKEQFDYKDMGLDPRLYFSFIVQQNPWLLMADPGKTENSFPCSGLEFLL